MEKYSKCITITLIKVVNNVLLKSNLLIASLLIQKKKTFVRCKNVQTTKNQGNLKDQSGIPSFYSQLKLTLKKRDKILS